MSSSGSATTTLPTSASTPEMYDPLDLSGLSVLDLLIIPVFLRRTFIELRRTHNSDRLHFFESERQNLKEFKFSDSKQLLYLVRLVPVRLGHIPHILRSFAIVTKPPRFGVKLSLDLIAELH